MEKTNQELRAELEVLQHKVNIALRIISSELANAEKDSVECQNKNIYMYYYAEGKRIALTFCQKILKT